MTLKPRLARGWSISKSFGRPISLIRDLDVQRSVALFPRDVDLTGPVRVRMFGGVGNKLVDEEAEGNRLVRRNHQVAELHRSLCPGEVSCSLGQSSPAKSARSTNPICLLRQ